MEHDDFLDGKELELLQKNLHKLARGFQVHAEELIAGKDPTGGMIPLHEQFNTLMSQANAA